MDNRLENLTTEQLIHELKNKAETHDFFSLPNFTVIGIEISNLNILMKNFVIIQNKAIQAKENGYYIEYIVLMSNFLEFYLKLYLTAKHINYYPEAPFGALIKKIDPDFDENIENLLVNFNKLRKKVVHRITLGEYNLNSMEKAEFEQFSELPKLLEDYVVKSVGVPVDLDNLKGIPGENIYSIKKS